MQFDMIQQSSPIIKTLIISIKETYNTEYLLKSQEHVLSQIVKHCQHLN